VVLFLPRGVFPTATGYWRRKQPRRPAPAEHAPADPGAAAVPDHGPRQDGNARQDGAGDVFEARGLVKAFGGLRAVDGADLVVAAGRVTGLIGPNGSGKTTLFNLVDGTVRAKSGQVVLVGRASSGSGARPGPKPGWPAPISCHGCSAD
jgi:ABC-type glutathione transport system ATPase component